MQKLENLPFLQQKIKALEAILKRKKSSKVSSFEKIEENSSVNYGLKIYENKKKEKEDSNVLSILSFY